MNTYRQTLLEVLESRRSRNGRYSLRAFAGACGVSATSLSQILSGKRPLTVKTARTIAERLAFAPDQKADFLGALARDGKTLGGMGPREEIDLERFRLIADWYHYAILSLADLPGQKAAPPWISEKLGITVTQARQARDRLVRLGMLRVERGKLKIIRAKLVTSHDVPSAALRSHHRQILDRANLALDSIPVEFREMGTITLSLDPTKLPQAKALIRRFRQELAAVCESGTPRLVYHFGTYLFPVNLPEKFLNSKESSDD